MMGVVRQGHRAKTDTGARTKCEQDSEVPKSGNGFRSLTPFCVLRSRKCSTYRRRKDTAVDGPPKIRPIRRLRNYAYWRARTMVSFTESSTNSLASLLRIYGTKDAFAERLS